MKTFIQPFLVLVSAFLIFNSSHSKGASFIITAGDFEFSPDTITDVNIGDTVQWVWQNGFHTTTSNGIPAGAAPWNELLDSINTTFTYVITVPGTYHYISVPDLPSMQGQFTVNSLIGITTPLDAQFHFDLLSNLTGNKIQMRFFIDEAASVEILLSDVSGKWKQMLFKNALPPGYHDAVFSLSEEILSGIYLITLRYKKNQLTKKIIVRR